MHNSTGFLPVLIPMLTSCLHEIDGLELVMVDDGSTDTTYSILEERVQAWITDGVACHRIQLLTQPNAGLSAARNAGMKIAKGRYVMFLDDDDQLDVKALRRFCSSLDSRAEDLIAWDIWERDGGKHFLNSHSARMGSTGPDFLCESIRQSGSIKMTAVSYVYSRSFIHRTGWSFVEGLLHEDCLSTPEALLAAQRIWYHPEPVYLYIRRSASLTRSADVEKMRRRSASLLKIAGRLNQLCEQQDQIGHRYIADAVLVWQLNVLESARALGSALGDDELIMGVKKSCRQICRQRPLWSLWRWLPVFMVFSKSARRIRTTLKRSL